MCEYRKFRRKVCKGLKDGEGLKDVEGIEGKGDMGSEWRTIFIDDSRLGFEAKDGLNLKDAFEIIIVIKIINAHFCYISTHIVDS